MVIGKYLRRLRKQRKLSLRTLAEKTGIKYVMIHRIENGQAEVRLSHLKSFAQAFEIEDARLIEAAKSARGRHLA
jgi:transcriptional regulator with XRE-family HTH domain